MSWCLAFYSATLLNYVPTFHRTMFGSFQLCSEVKSDYPNFLWLITTLAGFLIYDFCFYYSYRIMFGSMELCSASGLVASHAVVSRGLVLLPPHKRLLTQAPHSFPIVLLPKHPSQSPSRHCLTISNQIAGFNGRFRFPRALYSLWYSLERCGS